MTTAALWIGCALIGGLVAGRAGRHLARYAPLRRPNYRGLQVPVATGIAVVIGFLAGLGLVAALGAVVPSSDMLADAAVLAVPFMAAAVGFGLIGLWDDLTGRDEERGWRAHVRALRKGRATSGAIKLGAGAVVALVVVAPISDGIAWTMANGAIVALSANLFNLLDLRPGRASKVFILAAVAMLIVGGSTAPALVAAIGAVAGFAPLDLRERAMLGDTGANAMGAIVGYGIVTTGTTPARLVALVALVVLHLASDQPGLSRLIDRSRVLRRLDRVGRVREDAKVPGP